LGFDIEVPDHLMDKLHGKQLLKPSH